MQNELQSILIIEDDLSLLMAIKGKVERNGLKGVIARTVEQAMDHLSNSPRVSAIWLDHYLIGKENGIDFMLKIKDSGSVWKNIPVFVVSNSVGPDKIDVYMRLGAVKYYAKAEKRLDDIISDIKKCIRGSNIRV